MAIYYNGQPVGLNQVVEKLSYVEVPSGSTINDIDYSGSVTLTKPQVDDLQDAVNYRTGTFNEKTIAEMIAALNKKYQVNTRFEYPIGEGLDAPWVRPQEWPDLDSLNLSMSGDDFIYMTYNAFEHHGVSLTIQGSNINVTMGHINNGTYIVDETITKTNDIYTRIFDGTEGYPVVKVTGNITRCYSSELTVTIGSNVYKQTVKQQPIVERIGYIPHMDRLARGSSSNWGTYLLEHEKLDNGTGDALTYLGYAYEKCARLAKLEITGLKTHNVTSFVSMFSQCVRLSGTLNLTHFDVRKVTTFSGMFNECRFLKIIDLSGWNTLKLTTTGLSNMFNNCTSLKYIYGLNNFNIDNCTSLYNLFVGCCSLISMGDLSNWNTSKVTTFYQLFNGCFSVTNLEFVSHWNTSSLTNLYATFMQCYNIEKLDLHQWDTSKVTNTYATFYWCMSLKQLNITGWQINSTTSLAYTFGYCFNLEELDVSGWTITNTCTSVYYAFRYCCSLQKLDLPNNWDMSGLGSGSNTLNNMFSACWSLKRITGISNWNFQLSNSINSLFQECYSLEELDVSNWNVSTITSFASLFNSCYSLKNLNVSNWNTSSGTNFSSMFANCRSLKTLDVSNFNVSNATTLNYMFGSCYSLTSVGDLSRWNTSKITNLGTIFRYCYSLSSLTGLSNWDVSKVTDASYLVAECYSLKELTINNWNLAACTTLTGSFYYCYNLHTLTLNNWSLPKLTAAPTFTYNYSLTNCTGLPVALDHSYSNCWSLTRESIINIFTNLPTVSTVKKITLGSGALNQLSTVDRAIATNKGWTIVT